MESRVFYNAKEQACYIEVNGMTFKTVSCLIENPNFVVNQEMRSEFLRTGNRNNHAYCQGSLLSYGAITPMGDQWESGKYDREKGKFVIIESGKELKDARLALIVGCEIYVRF